MRCRIWYRGVLALGLLVLWSCQSVSPMRVARDDGWSHFGSAGREQGPIVALGAIEGGESNVIVQGQIVEVCQKKGCWMRVTDGGAELFVRFQDYGFFVPKDAAGRRVVMHGTSLAELASVEDLRHYAQDAGKSRQEIEAITEPALRVTFYADSVYIEPPADLDET